MKLRDLWPFGHFEPVAAAPGAAPQAAVRSGSEIVVGDLNDPEVVEVLRAGGGTVSGASVNLSTGMKVAAVWRCVHIIAGAIATLPLDLYLRGDEQVRRPAVDHPLRKVLTRKPNAWQTPNEFRRMMQAFVLLKGDAIALKVMSRGNVLELWPLHPDRVSVAQGADMALTYTYTRKDGGRVKLNAGDVFHLRGLTMDGVRGMGVLHHAREAVGLAIQSEKTAAKLFSNGTLANRALKHPTQLSDAAHARLTQALSDTHLGADNAQKTMILEEGMDFSDVGLGADDIQFLETRQFERSDIAMFFGVPPHMIGDVSKSTSWGSGIEAQGIGFVTYTLNDWIVTWEQAIERDLIGEARAGHPEVFAKIDTRGLMRGDFKGRTEGYAKALGAGGGPAWMTPNEVRALEDLPPIEGGEKLPKPTNVKPGAEPAPREEPDEPPPASDD